VIAGESGETAGDLLEPDTVVGSFRIRDFIGEGAMGQVYLAQDTTLGRRVALKLIKRSVMHGGGLDRFLAEARATASFNHPHIVTLHAVGELDGRPFLALEYIDGESLRQRIASGSTSVKEAMRIVCAVAKAVAEAHRHGIVHADLKPENIVIPRDGRVRVVDFGLARLVGTRTDTASGTPTYMAPERWRGQTPTGAIDVWSVGVLLHELVTGEPPLSPSALAELAYTRDTEHVPYLANGATWSMLVAECLRLDPSERITADALVVRLEAMIDPRISSDSEARCPFPGLSAFSRDTAVDYFGRRAELDEALEHLRRRALVPILGPSGVGKSSFVYAGLIPRLEEKGAWTTYNFRPGTSPFLALASCLAEGPVAELADSLRLHPERLSLVLGERARKTSGRVLLFVDQFEEVFTLAAGDARAFCECVARAAIADEPWRIVLTLRDDFFGRIAETATMRPLLGEVVALAQLSTADLQLAVMGPLTNAGYRPDSPDLVDAIVGEIEGTAAPLPLLQFTCRSLWERRDSATRTIQTVDYRAMGGASGALAAHAQQVLSRLSPVQVRAARALLVGLVNPDGTRRPRRRSDLLEVAVAASDVADRLLEGRLIVATRDADNDDAWLELAHESLAVAWPQLARWLDESHEERLLVTEIEQASRLWLRRGERDDETWTGPALAEAVRKLSEWNASLPTGSRAFIEAGRRRDLRQKRRRRWIVGTVIGALTVATLAAVVVAIKFSRMYRASEEAQTDLGTFTLTLRPFDWDTEAQAKRIPMTPPRLHWRLYFEDARRAHERGAELGDAVRRGGAWFAADGTVSEDVEAPAGPAILEIERDGCAPSRVFIKNLPGYRERMAGEHVTIAIDVPTCEATHAGTIQIPAGDFYENVDGTGSDTVDRLANLPTYRIDRTEVTRGAFAIYNQLERTTGEAAARGAEPGHTPLGSKKLPAVGVDFLIARDYCRFLGKELPSIPEWQKAFRGDAVIAGHNPAPKTATPWVAPTSSEPANMRFVDGHAGPQPVGSFPDDRSYYGVLDLSGNVSEWSRDLVAVGPLAGMRVVLGGNWDTPPSLGHQYIQWRNSRNDKYLDYVIGIRCVEEGPIRR